MFDFYEKRKIKKWLYSWPSLTILVIMSVFLAHGVWGVYQQEFKTRINKNQRIAHLDGLETRKNALEEEINRLNTGRGIEEEIRQKFEVAKDGEEVIVIVESPTNNPEIDGEAPISVFKKIIDMVIFWR